MRVYAKPVGARLAGDGVREIAIAGKPAPTETRAYLTHHKTCRSRLAGDAGAAVHQVR